MKRILFVVGLLAIAAVAPSAEEKTPAGATLIQDQYIVVLKGTNAFGQSALGVRSVPQAALELAGAHNGLVLHVYEAALQGFAVRMTAENAAKLAQDPLVDYVEQDQVMAVNATQTNATWGIDRIDQRALPRNGTYVYNTTATNVHAYIIDTGVLGSHSQFSGRMSNGFTAINDGRGTNDCNGHGTHVAGTVGGTTYGVAKGVRIHPVRVLSCTGSGSNSGVIAGVNWVTQNRIRPAVANMSLGGGISTALDSAVNSSINSGVTYAVAAGNSSTNACNSSPARVAAAITVGSTTSTDARSSFSNFGTCVDIFAPGSSITSAWSNGGTRTISGTSMASPHAAGVAALYLAGNTGASATTVRNAMVNASTPNRISNVGSGSPNRLLFSLF